MEKHCRKVRDLKDDILCAMILSQSFALTGIWNNLKLEDEHFKEPNTYFIDRKLTENLLATPDNNIICTESFFLKESYFFRLQRRLVSLE